VSAFSRSMIVGVPGTAGRLSTLVVENHTRGDAGGGSRLNQPPLHGDRPPTLERKPQEVARIFQDVRIDRKGGPQRGSGVGGFLEPSMKLPGQQGGSTGRAGGSRHECLLKQDTIAGHAIEGRGQYSSIFVDSRVRPAPIVGDDHQDVGVPDLRDLLSLAGPQPKSRRSSVGRKDNFHRPSGRRCRGLCFLCRFDVYPTFGSLDRYDNRHPGIRQRMNSLGRKASILPSRVRDGIREDDGGVLRESCRSDALHRSRRGQNLA